nr:Transcription termination factor like [Ipomoea batatas]
MLNFRCKSLPHLRYSYVRFTLTYNLYGTNASVESTSNNARRDSFTVSYLVNRCGFTPKKALSASKYINFKTPNRAESVLSFLKNHGFSETQALKVVRTDPTLLACNPEKSFLPKLEFFKSLGFPGEHLTHILCVAPTALRRSLERRLLPTTGFLENLLLSRESMRVAVRRYPNILCKDLKAHLEPNVQLLKEMGVPEHKIVYFLTHQPLTFMILTWEKKMESYRKWGLAENEIFEAFSRVYDCFARKGTGVILKSLRVDTKLLLAGWPQLEPVVEAMAAAWSSA